jgi:hypothetical protein
MTQGFVYNFPHPMMISAKDAFLLAKANERDRVVSESALSWLQQADEGMLFLLDLYGGNTHNWESLGSRDGFEHYRIRLPNSGVMLMKGIGIIQAGADQIARALMDPTRRSDWDTLFKERNVIENLHDNGLDDRTLISHLKFKTPVPLVQARDFCTLATVKVNRETGHGFFFSKSVLHPLVPESKDYVRGDLMASGFVVEPLGNGLSRFTYLVQVDPKGWIPSWISNVVSNHQFLTLPKIRNYILKYNNVVPHAAPSPAPAHRVPTV